MTKSTVLGMAIKRYRDNSLKSSYLIVALALLYLLPSISYATQEECDDASDSKNCVAVDQFSLRLALGLGVRSNPLHNADDIPLVLVPDIAWYGENWYLDNSEAGYQWQQDSDFAFETFVSVNPERGLFSRGHASNLFLSDALPNEGVGVETPVTTPNPDQPPDGTDSPNTPPIDASSTAIAFSDVASRDWALDAGIRFHWYGEQNEWRLAIFQDVTGVHKGQHVITSYRHNYSWHNWRLATTFALTWKSKKLVDYYYGLDARDGVEAQSFYQAEAGFYPSIRFSASRNISKQWDWLVFAKYTHLDAGMTDSPLVEEHRKVTLFTGVTYQF